MNKKHFLSSSPTDLICFSHLRWQFVFQRPQHLMSRFNRKYRVFMVEEPVFEGHGEPRMALERCPQTGVRVATPHLPQDFKGLRNAAIEKLILEMMRTQNIRDYIAWFYTPMALDYIPTGFSPSAVIYDCMDELSLFKNAPPRLAQNEARLFELADLVFTGGVSLFEHKCDRHPHVYACPSGVDIAHFRQARDLPDDFVEQADIPHPRIGFAGVIDERMNLDLVDRIAELCPDWHLVMIGPVVKIDPATLPSRPNIHWLGKKAYEDLPRFFSGWDAAFMPFALNDSTRFISPTKTPEFLAAGLPVVSTPIRDVVRPYGEIGLVRIADTAEEFVKALEQSMRCGMTLKWRERADAFLKTLAWDDVWSVMDGLIDKALRPPESPAETTAPSHLYTQGGEARV